MSDLDLQRHVLLNYLQTKSVTKYRGDEQPPTHGAREIFQILEIRRKRGFAIEFFDSQNDEDDAQRVFNGRDHSFIRIRHMRIDSGQSFDFVCLLIEYVNHQVRNFPVVHTETFTGREIAGEDAERGATAAHIVLRIPHEDDYDDGLYRCAIEAVPQVTRRDIEYLLTRQLRRYSNEFGLTFSVEKSDKRGKISSKEMQYRIKVELLNEVNRRESVFGDRELVRMLFSKRSEKIAAGRQTVVQHAEVFGDVEVSVSTKQGPADPKERATLFAAIRSQYEGLGYKTKLYFRHPVTGVLQGAVHSSIAAAADLLLCNREVITLPSPPKNWHNRMNKSVLDSLKLIVDNEALWQKSP